MRGWGDGRFGSGRQPVSSRPDHYCDARPARAIAARSVTQTESPRRRGVGGGRSLLRQSDRQDRRWAVAPRTIGLRRRLTLDTLLQTRAPTPGRGALAHHRAADLAADAADGSGGQARFPRADLLPTGASRNTQYFFPDHQVSFDARGRRSERPGLGRRSGYTRDPRGTVDSQTAD